MEEDIRERERDLQPVRLQTPLFALLPGTELLVDL